MNIKRILDLTQEIYHDSPVAPDLVPPQIRLTSIGARDGWTNEEITMTPHTATHMDSPSHVGGLELTLDQMPVDSFQGEMVLISLSKKPNEQILLSDIKPYEDQFQSGKIVVFYTGWGEKRGWTKEWLFEAPYLSLEAARYIAKTNIKGIGIDHASIGGVGKDNPEIHRAILEANIWVVENLQLDNPELRSGKWHLMSLPMKIKDFSGAPCRAIAIQYGE